MKLIAFAVVLAIGCSSRGNEPFSADEYLAKSVTEAQGMASDAELLSLEATMVKPDGMVDLKADGGLYVYFRSPSHHDRNGDLKPAIPGGPPPKDEWGPCPRIRVKTGTWSGARGRHWEFTSEWTRDDHCERSSSAKPPRCTFVKLWQRAITAGAPNPGYARIRMSTKSDGTRSWRFTIENVIDKTFPDDC